MKTNLLFGSVTGFAAFLALTVAAPARAQSLAACGDIHVEAQAECEVVPPSVECTGTCESIRFEAACAGELEVGCQGECNASATVQCTGGCQADCEAKCTVTPATFECEGSCNVEGNAHCSGQCGTDEECKASCKATYAAECKGRCSGTPASADCRAKCQASCQGSCKAEANAECQVDCQADGYVTCKSRLEGGCKDVACKSQKGALICDNQYVDYNNNLENCLDALEAELNIEVTYSSSGSCSNGRCEGEAEASASCALPRGGSASGAAGVFALAGLAFALRRRRV